jgi:hypothetical protein
LVTTWLPSLLIGSVLGYGIIYLREIGWLFAFIVTLGLLIVYMRQGRLNDLGLLLAAEGLWPTYVAGWGLWPDATRADTDVGPDMWGFLAVGLLLIVSGLAVFVVTARGGCSARLDTANRGRRECATSDRG